MSPSTPQSASSATSLSESDSRSTSRSETGPGHLGTQDDVLGARIVAFVVDYVLSFVVALALGIAIGFGLGSTAAVYLGVFLGLFGYFIVLEGVSGQTAGKYLMGIVVVSYDGSPITLRQSVVRNLLRLVDGILNYVVGLVVILLTDDRQRVGDLTAKTLVVRKRRRP